jgi:hypothetical protein
VQRSPGGPDVARDGPEFEHDESACHHQPAQGKPAGPYRQRPPERRADCGETKNLEKKESEVNQEERDMRKLDNGHLTAADRATLNQQQNTLSKDIYKDKHNSRVQNTDPKSEVGQRERNQQERIAQGVKSGQLTAGETAHLEGREAAINKEVHNDRAANGGKLTSAERRQVNRQEDRTSHAIYRKKHNRRVQ